MIDIALEDVVSLTDAAKLLPKRRGGKRPHVATLYRWASGGCRGVVLESLQVGATRCTSRQALQRFCERLTDAKGDPVVRTSRQRQAAIKRAERELDRAGIG